jgi:hypothetical protein
MDTVSLLFHIAVAASIVSLFCIVAGAIIAAFEMLTR